MKSERRAQAAWVESRQRWQINVQADGERRTFTSSRPGPRGRVEVEKKADAWLSGQAVGENIRMEALAKQYLESVEAACSTSHYNQQEQLCRLHILPIIGRKKVAKLTENDLQAVINRGYKDGLSKKTLGNLRSCLTAMIKYARRSKYTDLRPEDLVIPASAKRSNKEILSPEDVKKLFEISTTLWRNKEIPDWLIHAYRVQVLTGLRPGELIGLRWDDIRDGVIHVRRSVNIYGETTAGKNENAIRSIVVSSLVATELKAQRQQLVDAGYPLELVFPSRTTEKNLRHNEYYVAFRRYQVYNKFDPVISPYELRHTYVSVNDEMPTGLKKQVVGHSRSMDTEGIYGHKKAGDMRRAAEYSDAAFAKILGSDGRSDGAV
ncbi:MAG: tyrosine-type recombinase/integrase [Lawsonibacter sp.]|jgi:integrase|nr:tyrosine-type recombinase/integrase [Acutalibacter muris]MCI9026612.1 tyrosine-type recombinase/integrase [Lawsonibacter sp.]